jgi:hypothetical protein
MRKPRGRNDFPNGDRETFARFWRDQLTFSAAGLVAEVDLAGYRTTYVETDRTGVPIIPGHAARVARRGRLVGMWSRGLRCTARRGRQRACCRCH